MQKRIQQRWKQRLCKHDWRPALTSKGPAAFCGDCEFTELLTEAEFYARFGRMPRV